MNAPLPETATVVDTAQKAVTTTSILSHLRQNRIEYLLAIGIFHLLGLTDGLLTHAATVC